MSKKTRGAAELTILTLKKNFFLADFIKVNKEIDEWMLEQKGFRSRHMFQGPEDRIFDLLFWDTKAQGRKAMLKLMVIFETSPVHSMIDQRTVDWFVSPVAHDLVKPTQ